MSIIRINELPEGSGNLTNDDLFVFMDDPSGDSVTKKISWGNIDSPRDGIIYGRKDGSWTDITSPANLQIRRGTSSEASAIIPLQGEPVWQTDNKSLVVGDGQTAGGILIGPKVPKSILTLNSLSVTIPISSNPPPDIIRISAVIPGELGGITAPNNCYEILLINFGAQTITIRHQMSTIGGNPALIPLPVNRIITPNSSNYTLAGGQSVRLIYDTVVQRWRIT